MTFNFPHRVFLDYVNIENLQPHLPIATLKNISDRRADRKNYIEIAVWMHTYATKITIQVLYIDHEKICSLFIFYRNDVGTSGLPPQFVITDRETMHSHVAEMNEKE